MPLISQLFRRNESVGLDVRGGPLPNFGADLLWVFVNAGLSVVLVLLGGFFAGLTLAYFLLSSFLSSSPFSSTVC
jgi:hypothetical protein